MNKITTKFRTLGRLSVWGTIAFGIAIATSQTANAWQAINNIDNNVYFYYYKTTQTDQYNYDGELALGHTVSCGQDERRCGSGKGQDIYVAVPLVGAVRLLYPAVHVPPHGVVSFSPGFYTTSADERNPSQDQIPMQSPMCQRWMAYDGWYTTSFSWIDQENTSVCDQAPDRHRVP